MVCLLAGVLTLGDVGIQMLGQPAAEPDDPVIVNETDRWDTEGQMKAEYQDLEREEAEKKALLQKKEAERKAAGKTEQTEMIELKEEIRRVQLQKIVLKSRMNEKSFDK